MQRVTKKFLQKILPRAQHKLTLLIVIGAIVCQSCSTADVFWVKGKALYLSKNDTRETTRQTINFHVGLWKFCRRESEMTRKSDEQGVFARGKQSACMRIDLMKNKSHLSLRDFVPLYDGDLIMPYPGSTLQGKVSKHFSTPKLIVSSVFVKVMCLIF